MGTKVQTENYLPARYLSKDVNHESNGASWPSCFGESNLSNSQFYYGFLPRTVSDSHLGYDKDFVKQTMLEHDAIFKNQVYELHRLYRVQRDLMDEVRRKEQHKRRTPCEASSSSSPVPSQVQFENVERSPNFTLTNSVNGRPPILVPDTVQSSPNSAKGKGILTGPSSFPNCNSPRNSESDSRPTKLRRRMLDLQLPADAYIDTDEVVQFNDAKGSDYTNPSPNKEWKSVAGNGEHFLIQGDGSRSDLHFSQPKALADLNEPLLVEEATSAISADFLRHGGGRHGDSQRGDFSMRLVDTAKHVPQNPKNCTMNGTMNNVHYENRTNGADWFCYGLGSESKGSTRSINQGICLEKKIVPSQPVHILPNQACQSSAYLTGDHINGDPWREKAVGNVEKSGRIGNSLSSYNVPGSVASHFSNQPGYFHSLELGKPWEQSASSWGKPGSYFGQKSMPVQTSPYLPSATLSKSPQSFAQSNDMVGNNKWNLNNGHSVLGNETPVRNGFYEASSSAFRGFDYVNSNYIDKKVPCSSINYYKATSCIDLNPVKGMNLNVALPNGLSNDHIGQPDVKTVDKDQKSADPLAVLPWLRGKAVCNKEVESSRLDLNSRESALSCWGSSVASNSLEADVKAKISDNCQKILGVPIFENPPTSKKEVLKSMVVHCCSGNMECESSGGKVVFDINVPCDPTEGEVLLLEERTQTKSANRRHNFDLNSCVLDEEIPCETTFSVPEKGTSTRDTGIDLEAPVIVENEEAIDIIPDGNFSIKNPEKQQVLPQCSADDEESELARSAASAIIAISSFVNLNQSSEANCTRVETDLDDPLKWFVEIACSSNGIDHENGDDLDDFEMMTLRQKECTQEEYFPEPCVVEVPIVEEKETCVLTTRTRKGHARRGRQRRDFQRDILPGLTSLSRHEVTEDLQMFGGLMRAIGQPWHSGPNRRNATRNGCGRGRPRSVRTAAAAMSPSLAPVAGLCALPVKQQNVQSNNTEVGVDNGSLTGWGKTTRRPRRQRVPADNPAPPLVPLT